jgi:adenylate cyclase
MMQHLHWKVPSDVIHYRDGLSKAGVPVGKLTLIGSSPKLAADS